MQVKRVVFAMVLSGLGLALGACESYSMRGHVIRGDVSYIQIVSADDSRLSEPGISGARVGAHLDPGRLNRKFLGSTMTDGNGDFSLPIDEVGAGWLEYDISVVSYRDGFMGAEQFFRIPKAERRVLIMLAPGDDAEPPSFESRESLFDEADRYR